MHHLNQLSVLIVDDEAPARQRLQRLISSIDILHAIGEAENAEFAIQQIQEQQPDLVFLDISMPSMNGIQLANWLSEQYPAVKIIFTTAYDEYALEAFDVNATDYLLKPIRRERLQKAVQKLIPASTTFYSIKDGQSTYRLNIQEIIWLHADQKYTEIHTKEKTYLTNDSLKDFEQAYPNTFLRIHRSSLINPKFLQGVEQHQQTMLALLNETDNKPEVSRRHQSDVRNFLKV